MDESGKEEEETENDLSKLNMSSDESNDEGVAKILKPRKRSIIDDSDDDEGSVKSGASAVEFDFDDMQSSGSEDAKRKKTTATGKGTGKKSGMYNNYKDTAIGVSLKIRARDEICVTIDIEKQHCLQQQSKKDTSFYDKDDKDSVGSIVLFLDSPHTAL